MTPEERAALRARFQPTPEEVTRGQEAAKRIEDAARRHLQGLDRLDYAAHKRDTLERLRKADVATPPMDAEKRALLKLSRPKYREARKEMLRSLRRASL